MLIIYKKLDSIATSENQQVDTCGVFSFFLGLTINSIFNSRRVSQRTAVFEHPLDLETNGVSMSETGLGIFY